jgi:hypothetical protein
VSAHPPLKQPTAKNKELNVVEISGVEFFIYWDKLTVEASFFLPTTATPKQIAKILDPIAEQLQYKLEVRARCEYGRYGARVWRTY